MRRQRGMEMELHPTHNNTLRHIRAGKKRRKNYDQNDESLNRP